MTRTDKRNAIIVGVIIAILLFIAFRKNSFSVLPNNTTGNIVLPGLAPLNGMGGRTGTPITIPGLHFGERDLQTIGACCSDCNGGPTGNPYEGRGTTLVFNEASRGPTIFNYISQMFAPPPAPRATLSWSGITK